MPQSLLVNDNVDAMDSIQGLYFYEQESFQRLLRDMIRAEVARAFAVHVTATNGSEPAPTSVPTTNLQRIIQDHIAATVGSSVFPEPSELFPSYSPAASASEVMTPAKYPDVAFHTSQVTPLAPLTHHGYQRSRSYEAWRVRNGRPICYSCGTPGHIARFCRRNTPWYDNRLHTFLSYDDEFESPSKYSGETYTKTYHSTHRGRSPSPRRRSSSLMLSLSRAKTGAGNC